jgi:hypothetical protein
MTVIFAVVFERIVPDQPDQNGRQLLGPSSSSDRGDGPPEEDPLVARLPPPMVQALESAFTATSWTRFACGSE